MVSAEVSCGSQWSHAQPHSHVSGGVDNEQYSSQLTMFTNQIWLHDLSHYHDQRELSTAAPHCLEELQVPLYSGVLVEAAGTCAGLISGLILLDTPRLAQRPHLLLGLDALVAVVLVMAGFDLTGGYYSPSLALGLKYGCGEGGALQHILLYTLSPCVGALIAEPVYSAVKKQVSGETKKDV